MSLCLPQPSPDPAPELLSAIARTAVEAARAAAAVQMRHFRKGAPAARRLTRDVKLEVDRRCEAAVIQVIRARFPAHAILAEEGGAVEGREPFLWVVDPLDGTVNFFHGLPQFCACVACCRLSGDGAPPANAAGLLAGGLVGVVLAPGTGELFTGVRGRGAALDGRPLACSDARALEEAIVALSFGKTEAAIARMGPVAVRLARAARKVRSYGCAGLDIVQVADGRLGGVIYQGLHLWDFAAAGIILAEAGGRLSAAAQPDGTWNVLAAAPGLHEALARIAPVA